MAERRGQPWQHAGCRVAAHSGRGDQPDEHTSAAHIAMQIASKGGKELDLRDLGLSRLPESVLKLGRIVEKLLLWQNMSIDPAGMERLSALRSIDLGGCGLEHIPEQLIELRGSLVHLDLYDSSRVARHSLPSPSPSPSPKCAASIVVPSPTGTTTRASVLMGSIC